MVRWYRWLIFSAIGGLCLLAVDQGWLAFLTDENRVAAYLSSHGPAGWLVVTAAGSVFTAAGGPRQMLAFVLGFALDSIFGTVLSTVATLIGASMCFWTARLLFRHGLIRRFGSRMVRFDKLFGRQTTSKILVVRLLPVGSNLLTNLIAGCSGIRFTPFAAGSALGYLPQMLVFAMAGAGIGNADHYQFGISLALFILASLIGGYLFHQQRNHSLTTPLSQES